MVISTTRFGRVQIKPDDILVFPEGILGFNELKNFVLLDDPNDEIFAWLQSCESEEVAFPVLEPEIFLPEYKIMLSRPDLDALQMTSLSGSHLFTIITIPDDPTQMTANLKAPIVINLFKKIGRQCVLQDNSLAIREPIFNYLQQRVVQYPHQTIKSLSPALEVAIRLPLAEQEERPLDKESNL